MTDFHRSVYLLVLQQRAETEEQIAAELGVDPASVSQACVDLQSMHLLTAAVDTPAYVPLSPRLAESAIAAQLEESLHQLHEDRARVHREMSQLLPEYVAQVSDQQTDNGLRCIGDPNEVQHEINVMTVRCSDEVWTMQPGGRRRWAFLEETIKRDRQMLERGLRMRVLYHHAARSDYAAQKYVETLTAAGAEVRTADELIERMMIFDRSVVFIAMPRTNNKPPGAIVVTDATLVGILIRTYEAVWRTAHVIGHTGETSDTSPVTGEVRAMLLRLMAEGHKDEAIAKRMGIATRTCRRYISDLLNELGAVSRFQAGVKVGLAGWDPGESDRQ